MKLYSLEKKKQNKPNNNKKPNPNPTKPPTKPTNPTQFILDSKYVYILKFSYLPAYRGSPGWNELLRAVTSFL